MDGEWNFLGSSWSDAHGSGENIRIDTFDGSGNLTGYKEIGTSTWKNDQNKEETRSFEFNFNAAGEMIGGTETHPDGRTVTLGPNWEVQGEKMSISGLSKVTGSDLDALPTQLKAASGDTYSTDPRALEFFDGTSRTGTQTTYLDKDGNILGYKDTEKDGDFNSFHYMDANFMPIGGGGSDDRSTWSEMRAEVTDTDGSVTGTAGAKYIQETMTDADKDGSFSRTEVRNMDANGNFLGGYEQITEKVDGETVIFKNYWDANRQMTKQEMSDEVDKDGNPIFAISDPFALFQPGDFVISKADLEYYGTNVEKLRLLDFDTPGSPGTPRGTRWRTPSGWARTPGRASSASAAP